MKKELNLFSKKITYLVLFILFIAAVFFIKPFIDDWLYYTTPQKTFDISGLLPSAVWWRPFDYLVGLLLGAFPFLFPALNHFIVIAGHIVGAYFLHAILKDYLKFSEKTSTVSTLFFVFSAGTFAALGSVDSLNQIWSSTFGIIGLYFYYKFDTSKKTYNYLLSLLMCVLAVFSKDSGIIWFAVIPLLGILPMLLNGEYETDNHKKTAIKIIKFLFIAAIFCIAYFAARFLLLGNVELGKDDSVYSLSLTPKRLLRNLAVMLAANFTAVDSLAVFISPRNYPLIAVTFALSVPFLIFILVKVISAFKNKSSLFALLLIAFTMFIGISPYLIMYAAGEMHAYQLVFFVSLLVAFLLGNKYNKKLVYAVFACFLISSVLVSGHKWAMMKNLGDGAEYVGKEIAAEYENKTRPENVAIVILKNQSKGYSIFYQPVGECAKYGYSVKSQWNWDNPDNIEYFECSIKEFNKTNTDEIIKDSKVKKQNYDAVWIVASNGDYEILNKGIDY